MNIVPLYDHNIIRSVIMHEDILPVVSDDTWPGVYHPDTENKIFLGCVTEEGLIGVYILHWSQGVTLESHAHILKKFRKHHSRESAKAVMRWVLTNVEKCKKIDCWAPTVYPNVKQFLAACGFTEEGVSRASFMHKGQLYDRTLMGITREEMEEFCND